MILVITVAEKNLDTLKDVTEKLPLQFKQLGPYAYEAEIQAIQRSIIEEVLKGKPIDYAFIPKENRKKKLLLADMDSTIVTSETLDDLAAHVGFGEQVATITTRAMNGEIDFIDALHERVALLKGKPASLLEEVWQEIQFTSGAKTLVKTMRHHGAKCILASGGFNFFTEKVKSALGFHETYANTLNITDNALTGTVGQPILTGQTKKEILLKHNPAEAVTVGDGANDLPMLTATSEAGGLGVAFHAKPVVQEQAQYQIRHTDLTTLLYFQGYSADMFID